MLYFLERSLKKCGNTAKNAFAFLQNCDYNVN